MRKFSTSFYAITILLAVLAHVESGLATYYKPYEQPEQMHPASSPPIMTPTANPSTCRKTGQVCRIYGPYSCCKGLWCVADVKTDIPSGFGTCLPLNPPPRPPPEKCLKKNQFCQTYGPSTCCKGLHCIHPRTLPPAAGLNPENMKPPPGFGLCTTI